jgi:hypothetical protein
LIGETVLAQVEIDALGVPPAGPSATDDNAVKRHWYRYLTALNPSLLGSGMATAIIHCHLPPRTVSMPHS